jgi:hypothetical protein
VDKEWGEEVSKVIHVKAVTLNITRMSYVLEFLAARLVHVYGELPNTDYILAAREYVNELRGVKK